jgi:DNA replication protein DnaC
MSAATLPVQQATIRQYAKRLQLVTIAGQFVAMAEQAIKEKQSHLNYLEVMLGMEVEERERNTVARRIKDAHFPKVKTLEEFAFGDAPHIPAAVVRNLAEGGYMQRSEPIIFLGEAGTGKTHLATGLAVEACRQRKRVRFTTAAEMVNELTEAKNNSELNRVTRRWTRYELIVIDEMAYVAMPETAAEMLFQIIAGRAERAAVMVTTNLPFSEWTTMFPNARLCKAMLDRLTDQAHIIETGTESYRFRRTLEKKKGGKNQLTTQWYRATPGSIRKKQKRGGRRAVEKAGPWKARKTKGRFSSLPTALGIPHNPRDPTFPTAPTAAVTNNY